jgi:2-oxoisovalerate ferredoxin oxidoreductase beta subunit
VCEVLNQLKAPVYIERVSVADTARIMKARQAVRKALEIQRDRKGYAFVEFISPCPTSVGEDPLRAARFCIEEMETEFPLGCLRDASASAAPRAPRPPAPSVTEFFGSLAGGQAPAEQVDEAVSELRLKFAGFGGQGILSLGICVAEAARLRRRYATWFPSYGPEMRGGAAACSVVLSGKPIGSPIVDRPDVLVCMNLPSFERFAGTVGPHGLAVVDTSVSRQVAVPDGVRVVGVPAIELAAAFGMPKAANTVMLAALSRLGATGLAREDLLQALDASFRRKPALVEPNRRLFVEAERWMAEHVS